jgi:hypothetical protein
MQAALSSALLNFCTPELLKESALLEESALFKESPPQKKINAPALCPLPPCSIGEDVPTDSHGKQKKKDAKPQRLQYKKDTI